MKKVNLYIIILLMSSYVLDAQTTVGVGAYLKYGISARAMGMGSAYTAISTDPSATYWNPAGLLESDGMQIQIDSRGDLVASNSFLGVNNSQIAISHAPRKRLFRQIKWAWGIAFSGYSVEEIHQYDVESNYISDFNFRENFILGSLAFKVRMMEIGLTWKYIDQNFDLTDPFYQDNNESIIRKPHDLGIRIHPFDFLTIGLVIRDSLRVGLYDSYPKTIQSGLAFHIKKLTKNISLPNVIFATDLIMIHHNEEKLNIGFEYSSPKLPGDVIMAVRLGRANILNGSDENNFDFNQVNIFNQRNSAGIGLDIKDRINVDLAYIWSAHDAFSKNLIMSLKLKLF